jgi:streptogramin lyase
MRRTLSMCMAMAIVCGLLAACASPAAPAPVTSPTPVPTPRGDGQTHVVIDGLGEDWQSYPVATVDGQGDQSDGTPDLGEVRAFCNDSFFYLFIRLNAEGATDHYDVLMDVNGGDFDYQISFWPDRDEAVFSSFPVVGEVTPLAGVHTAQNDVIELKMPLSAVGGRPVRAIFVQTWMAGVVGDRVDRMSVYSADETDLEIATAATPSPVPTRAASPTPSYRRGEGTVLQDGYIVESVYQNTLAPAYVRIGPEGEVLAVQMGSDSIMHVHEDGSLSVYASFPGTLLLCFNFDPAGNLWFSVANSRDLYRVNADGAPEVVATNTNRGMEFDSQGNAYLVDFPSHDIQLLTPNGRVSVLADGFGYMRHIALGPNDELVAMDEAAGILYTVAPDGTKTELASGFGPDFTPHFAPDGTLYVLQWSGLQTVDLHTGAKRTLDWFAPYANGNDAVFDSQGRMYTFHPNEPIYRVDLAARTSELVFNPRGNTPAMAVAPDGGLYLAYGSELPRGETEVYRVGDNDVLTGLLTVPYGQPATLAFGPDGEGYLGVNDRSAGSALFSFDPLTGSADKISERAPRAIAFEPQSGEMWWVEGLEVHHRPAGGREVLIPPPPNTDYRNIAFGTDGTLYAMIWTRVPDFTTPAPHGIYRLQDDGSWLLLADMTMKDPNISLANVFTCANGTVITLASIDPDMISPTRDYTSFNALLQMQDDSSLKLLAYDLNIDGFTAQCVGPNVDVYFTTSGGVYRYHQP